MGNCIFQKNQTTQMGFSKLKVSAKVKSGRGSADATAVVEAMMDAWDDLQEAIGKLNEEEKKQLTDHFNGFIDGEDDLGDILFGSAEDFDSRVKFLDDEVQKKYTDEIKAQEVIDL